MYFPTELITGPMAQAVAAFLLACMAIPLLLPRRAEVLPRQPRPPAQRKVQADVSPAPAPITRTPHPLVITRDAAFQRMSAYIEKSGDRVKTVHSATLAASRHIDNAEMALLRLIREVTPVMSEPPRMPLVPRTVL